MSSILDILIIGGGVAGPALAIALGKTGKQVRVTIAEATLPSPSDVGTYFTITENGVNCLRTLGMEQAVRSAGYDTTSSLIVNPSGKKLLTLPFGDSITVRRARVHNLLLSEAQQLPFVSVLRGHRLVDATTDCKTGKVNAVFENGATVQCDLLVGADGIRSRVRTIIDPSAQKEGRYIGLVNFAGTSPKPPSFSITPGTWHFCFGTKAFFLCHAAGPDQVLWGINQAREAISREERQQTSDEEWKQQLVQVFADDSFPAAAIIASGKIEFSGDNQCDIESVKKWHNGHMVIVGDAAHAPAPTSGQGASMALEDAIMLARALRDYDQVAEALTIFEAHRRGRVEKIVAYGRKMSSSKMPGPLARRVRDILMPITVRFIDFKKLNAWIHMYQIPFEEPLPRVPEVEGSSSSMRKYLALAVVGGAAAVAWITRRRMSS